MVWAATLTVNPIQTKVGTGQINPIAVSGVFSSGGQNTTLPATGARFSAMGLPQGLSIDPDSGIISGTLGDSPLPAQVVVTVSYQGLSATTSFWWASPTALATINVNYGGDGLTDDQAMTLMSGVSLISSIGSSSNISGISCGFNGQAAGTPTQIKGTLGLCSGWTFEPFPAQGLIFYFTSAGTNPGPAPVSVTWACSCTGVPGCACPANGDPTGQTEVTDVSAFVGGLTYSYTANLGTSPYVPAPVAVPAPASPLGGGIGGGRGGFNETMYGN
jgi:hypothetical protein